MKQLLSCCSSSSSGDNDNHDDVVFVVGLKDCAYAVLHRPQQRQQQQQQGDIVVAMLPPTTNATDAATVNTTGEGEKTSSTEVSGSSEAVAAVSNTTTKHNDDIEEKTSSSVAKKSSSSQKRDQQQQQQQKKKRNQKKIVHDDNTKNKDIDSVAIYKYSNSSGGTPESKDYWCAITRMDKSLEIYNFDFSTTISSSSSKTIATTVVQQPKLLYKTPKRVGCMCFTDMKLDEKSNTESTTSSRSSIPCLVVGDVSGDSYAYGLLQRGRKLLLGHTASMITSVCCVFDDKQKLITADRDEKIRISKFPQTYDIDDYLLGHEEYITSIDFASTLSLMNNNDNNILLLSSCGGDSTLRLWDINSHKQICQVYVGCDGGNNSDAVMENKNNDNGNDADDDDGEQKSENLSAPPLIPTDLTMSKDGKKIGIIFDESNKLDIYEVVTAFPHEEDDDDKKEEGLSLKLIQTIVCPSQPLSVSFLGRGGKNDDDELLVVVVQDSDYVLGYKLNSDTKTVHEEPMNMDGLDLIRKLACERNLIMPTTILEKDEMGQPKLKKTTETRGPSKEDQPWNRVERLENEKKRNSRRKKRRHEEARQRDEEEKSNNNNNKKTKI